MTYALIAVIVMLLAFDFWLSDQIGKERRAWIKERGELLNRIQRPEVIPIRPVENFAMPERELDDWNAVGTIDLSEPGADG